jgi:hypothetical protein
LRGTTQTALFRANKSDSGCGYVIGCVMRLRTTASLQELQAMPEAPASTLDSSTVASRRGTGTKAADIEKANSQT